MPLQSQDGIGDLPACASAWIHEIRAAQGFESCLIGGKAPGLDHDFVVPVHAKGCQLLQDDAGGAGYVTGGVEIFDAQQPAPAACPGVKIARDGRNGGALVQRTAGAGRKTTGIGSGTAQRRVSVEKPIVVVAQKLFEHQVIHFGFLAPEHHQRDDLDLLERDRRIDGSHGAINDDFPQRR